MATCTQAKPCFNCGKHGATLLCGRCKMARYCNVLCQRNDWKSHKPKCTTKKLIESKQSQRGNKKGQVQEETNKKHINKPPCVQPYSKKDDLNRHNWKANSCVEIYSEGQHKWHKGQIVSIFNDNEGEWLVIKYARFRTKEIQRFSNYIRPVQKQKQNSNYKPKCATKKLTEPKQSHKKNEIKYKEFECGNCSNNGAKKKCGGCNQMFYCSEHCQLANWSKHKKYCGHKNKIFNQQNLNIGTFYIERIDILLNKYANIIKYNNKQINIYHFITQ
eukprot:549073_1